MGRRAARRALLGGVRLGRIVRGAGRGHRREVREPPRPPARALLDRGCRRRARRVRVLRQEIEDGREAAAPARRAARAPPRGPLPTSTTTSAWPARAPLWGSPP